MRIRTSRFLACTLFLALMAGGSLTARAEIVTVVFSGTLTSASNVPNGVAANDTIAGTVAFNSSQSETGTTGIYTFTGSSSTHAFSFQIYPPNTSAADQTEANLLFSDSYSGESTSPFKAQVSYSSSGGTSLTISGDTGSTNTGTFSLSLVDPTNGGGYSAGHLPLPTSTVMEDFITKEATLVYTDGFMAKINDFAIYTNYSSPGPTGPPVASNYIPEPASLLLAIVGTLSSAVGCSIGRRRVRAVKPRDR